MCHFLSIPIICLILHSTPYYIVAPAPLPSKDVEPVAARLPRDDLNLPLNRQNQRLRPAALSCLCRLLPAELQSMWRPGHFSLDLDTAKDNNCGVMVSNVSEPIHRRGEQYVIPAPNTHTAKLQATITPIRWLWVNPRYAR